MGSRGSATRARGIVAAVPAMLALALAVAACGAGAPERPAGPAASAQPGIGAHQRAALPAPQPARAGALLRRGIHASPSGAVGDDDDREVVGPGRALRPGDRARMASHALRLDLELRTRPIDRHLYGRAPPIHTPHEE